MSKLLILGRLPKLMRAADIQNAYVIWAWKRSRGRSRVVFDIRGQSSQYIIVYDLRPTILVDSSINVQNCYHFVTLVWLPFFNPTTDWFFNPFQLSVALRYSLKTFFSGYSNATLDWNGLRRSMLRKLVFASILFIFCDILPFL